MAAIHPKKISDGDRQNKGGFSLPSQIRPPQRKAQPATMADTATTLTTNQALLAWVDEIAALTTPDRVHWCDGSAEEYDGLCPLLLHPGPFTRLAEAKRPNSYWAASDPGDVARVEDRTFICSKTEDEAGPTKNWRGTHARPERR